MAGRPEAHKGNLPHLRGKASDHASGCSVAGTCYGSSHRGGITLPPLCVRGNDPELASYLRIEERELEAGGLN
jgi:hypothetical protein